jgi:flavin reductase (DIM6/NTAB) family NADH-FMN oxidoreductase RutF
MLRDVEYCGLVSGRDVNKCSEVSFTLKPSKRVKPPLIEECPLNLECEVKKRVPLGSSVLFLGEVVCLHVDDAVLDEKGGVDLAKAAPIVFNLTNSYWRIGEKLADYGFSRSKST